MMSCRVLFERIPDTCTVTINLSLCDHVSSGQHVTNVLQESRNVYEVLPCVFTICHGYLCKANSHVINYCT